MVGQARRGNDEAKQDLPSPILILLPMLKHLIPAAMTITVAACAQPEAPSVGMANPASAYCQSLGGKLIIQPGTNGQVGICNLPGGTQIEEWALYRRDHPAK